MTPAPWIVVDIGCLECGERTSIVGAFATELDAERARARAELSHAEYRLHPHHQFAILRPGGPSHVPISERPIPAAPVDVHHEIHPEGRPGWLVGLGSVAMIAGALYFAGCPVGWLVQYGALGMVVSIGQARPVVRR